MTQSDFKVFRPNPSQPLAHLDEIVDPNGRISKWAHGRRDKHRVAFEKRLFLPDECTILENIKHNDGIKLYF